MRDSGQAANGSGDRSWVSTGLWTDSRVTSGRGSAGSPPSRIHRYGYGATKCHMSRPVSRATTYDTAQIAGTNAITSVRVSSRLSAAPAIVPSASARTMLVNTNPNLMTLPSVMAFPCNVTASADTNHKRSSDSPAFPSRFETIPRLRRKANACARSPYTSTASSHSDSA